MQLLDAAVAATMLSLVNAPLHCLPRNARWLDMSTDVDAPLDSSMQERERRREGETQTWLSLQAARFGLHGCEDSS